MTYRSVLRLAPSAARVAQQVEGTSSSRSADVRASVLLRQYGFLLGTAPLSQRGRLAVLDAVAALPGLRLWGEETDRLGRSGIGLCIRGGPSTMRLVLDTRSGVALAVTERLDQTSDLFPNLSPGQLLETDTFVQYAA